MANDRHNNNKDGDWIEYRRLVLAELSRLESRISELDKESQEQLKGILSDLKEDLAGLDKKHDDLEEKYRELSQEVSVIKVKSGLWGGLVSAVIAIAAFLIKLF